MGRLYEVTATDVTVLNAATTLTQTLAPIGTYCRPHRIHVSQGASTTQASQRLQFHRKVSAFSTVTSFTPIAISQSNTMASACVGGVAATGINASAEGAGAETILWVPRFNVAGPFDHIFTEREKEEWTFGGAAATAFCVKLASAPGTYLTLWCVSFEYEED